MAFHDLGLVRFLGGLRKRTCTHKIEKNTSLKTFMHETFSIRVQLPQGQIPKSKKEKKGCMEKLNLI